MKNNSPDTPIMDAAAMPDQSSISESTGVADGIAGQAGFAAPHIRKERELAAEKLQSWRKRRKLAVAIVVGLVLLLAGGGIAYFNMTKDKPQTASSAKLASLAPVVTVTTVAATERPVNDALTVTGSISPWDELNIGSELGGLRIDKVNFEEGDIAKKGQVLVKLNSSLLEAQLAEQESMLDSSKASLSKSMQPNRPEELTVLNSALSQAEDAVLQEEAHKRQVKVKLENADINVDRFKLLATEGAKSDQDLEEKEAVQKDAELELISAEHKVEAARRAADQAREHLKLGRKGGRAEDIEMSKATVEECRARVRHLSAQIKQTTIQAPDDGLIVKRSAHIGDICESTKPLLTMIRLNRLELKAQANDSDLPKFKEGQSVNVSTSGVNPTNAVGRVRLVSPQLDSSSRMGTVHIDLPANSGLKSGMFVRGEIILASKRALTVPIDSVVTRGGKSFVFTLNGDRAVSTPVVPGAESEEYVEIKSGLKAGQLVVGKGARFLSDRDVVDLAH